MNKKSNPKITFEKIILEKGKDSLRQGVEVFLKVDGNFVDADSLRPTDQIIHRVRGMYWRVIKKLHVPGCGILVRLSGLHYDPFAAKIYQFSDHERNNMIVEYRSWRLRDFTEGKAFCLIECNQVVFKQLFEQYWFSLGEERRFEAFAVKKEKLTRLDKWYKQAENRSKETQLYSVSQVVVDNLHNGMHFRLLSKRLTPPLLTLLRDLK